ncbi:ribosomal protein L17 [Microstroma glucosiphilum]|uniref:Ribosomal protein L17 n=1 Tax=Pseudomicrostroma glucosiphilum TaxID=1684307 RepID=A0A316U523_9BASI|nr:ribosomal protein L17 [Pseudomicrostroma glucosiphilum]PWN19433.1 ribosomal protein L17 [Pseudomicrostroma glucosiphilum]
MKGHAFRKLSRTSGHRNHLLRNLVTSLFQHERISTTVAKAKEAQREAEKIITKAKRSQQMDRRGANQQAAKASGYVFARDTTVPILQQLAQRYAERPGGYTRLHLHGNRPGDNAPRALLELVDNSKGDLRFEMTARAMARETLLRSKRSGQSTSQLGSALFLDQTQVTRFEDNKEAFNELTRLNIRKLVRYTGRSEEEMRRELAAKAEVHLRRLRAAEEIDGPGQARPDEELMEDKTWKDLAPRGRLLTPPRIGRRYKAGGNVEDMPTATSSGSSSTATPSLLPGQKAIWQPQLLKGRKKNSVIRLGKGQFAKRAQNGTRSRATSFKSSAAAAVPAAGPSGGSRREARL